MTVRLPRWTVLSGLAIALVLAWANFLFTSKWAALPGALHGWKAPWYAAALAVTTVVLIRGRRQVGYPVAVRGLAPVTLVSGAIVIIGGLLLRLPLSDWSRIPLLDDWTPLFREAVNGVALLKRGVVVGWNWSFLGGYPTSTAIAQNLAALSFLPMAVFGDRIGFHALNAIFFLSLPAFVWWDLRQENRTLGMLAGGFACVFVAGLYGTLGSSGDVNSLAGVFSFGLALVGSRAARLGRRWGSPVLLLGLTCGLYSHVGFFVYALIFLGLESVYFRDAAALRRVVLVTVVAGVAALPLHWESIWYSRYLIVNNEVFDPSVPTDWPAVMRSIYHSIEILAFPHRWFNDYRSVINVWWPAILLVALCPVSPKLAAPAKADRSRVGFYAWAVLLAQVLLRFNTPAFGVIFDRIQHLFPILAAPALAGVVLRMAGTRTLAIALTALIALYVQSDVRAVPHVSSLRDFDASFTDHLAALDGNLVLVEVSPHHDMDSDPVGKSPKPYGNVHFEGLLPTVAGQRFYSQPWDGWAWNIFRGQLVAAGTFRGQAIAKTPVATFEAEMRRWGVKHLLVWTDAAKGYLTRSGRFVERWHNERWSAFELPDADIRSVVTTSGTGRLTNMDALGADVELDEVTEGDLVVVRTNFYPAWRATSGGRRVALEAADGQLAFRAPASGQYIVRLEYPRRLWLSAVALVVLIAGGFWLARRQPL